MLSCLQGIPLLCVSHVPLKTITVQPLPLVLLTLSPSWSRCCEPPGHQPFLSVWRLVLDFLQRLFYLCFGWALPPLYSSHNSSDFSFPTCAPELAVTAGIFQNWHIFLWLHIISGLQCSSGNTKDHRLCVVLFAICRDLMFFWAKMCGEVQIRWQLLPSRFGFKRN